MLENKKRYLVVYRKHFHEIYEKLEQFEKPAKGNPDWIGYVIFHEGFWIIASKIAKQIGENNIKNSKEIIDLTIIKNKEVEKENNILFNKYTRYREKKFALYDRHWKSYKNKKYGKKISKLLFKMLKNLKKEPDIKKIFQKKDCF